jgi:hypothetical protein
MKIKFLIALLTGLFGLSIVMPLASANQTAMSPYSWDPGLFATTTRYNDSAHAWGQRKTGGAWGTGSVNYQSGSTNSYRASSSGSLDVRLDATYCPNNTCSYGSGTGYKGIVQFWNDPSNFIAFGLIHDPGVSPTGTTLMIEGSANGKPVGGYQGNNGLTGASHLFSFTWDAAGISVTIDHQVTLGKYPVSQTNPSISFLSAARQTGDIVDTTFDGITFSPGSVVDQPVVVPAGTPYFTMSSTLAESGSGSGYSAYINSHDANSNALSVGIQTDTGSPESNGRPSYIWERVQNGKFTYDYLGPASNGQEPVTLKWWKGDDTAVFYAGNTPLADISLHLDPRLFFGVEGNARLNGDSVNSTFSNVQVTVGDTCPTYCGLNGSWNVTDFNFYGLHAYNTNGQPKNGANFTVNGTVAGLPPGADWDSNLVAGIGMIAQYYAGQ